MASPRVSSILLLSFSLFFFLGFGVGVDGTNLEHTSRSLTLEREINVGKSRRMMVDVVQDYPDAGPNQPGRIGITGFEAGVMGTNLEQADRTLTLERKNNVGKSRKMMVDVVQDYPDAGPNQPGRIGFEAGVMGTNLEDASRTLTPERKINVGNSRKMMVDVVQDYPDAGPNQPGRIGISHIPTTKA